MLTTELMKIINSGKVIPVEFNAYVEDLEIRYEKGMRAYIVKANEDNGNCIIFKTEEREFADYNKELEQPIWRNDQTGLFELKWSELKSGIYDSDYEIWEDKDEELCNFEVIDSDKLTLYNQYKNENTALTYLQWLENKLFQLL
jgi:hypothetical protein